MWNRRAALDGLSKILDAAGLEELFTGPDDEAALLYDLLADVARGRASSCYWEICRTARRRGVTPEYVIDRAAVMMASMEERRRTDLYRLLGAPPLAAPDTLRQCWLDFAKTGHPDVGGDAGRFRLVKEAYEILRDPDRRAEYERFWVRALGPFERVAPVEEGAATVATRPAMPAVAGERRVVMVVKKAATPPSEADETPDGMPALRHRAARLFAARDVVDRRIHPVLGGSMGGIGALLARVEEALAPVPLEEIERLRAEVERGIAQLETVRGQLDTVAEMKRALAV